MIGAGYTEIVEMIMRRLKLKLTTGDLDTYSDNLSFPYEENESVDDSISVGQPGKPKTIKAFEDYDYKLTYNEDDELTGFSSHDEKIQYTLNKDSFGDLTTVSVQTPGLDFKIGLIFESYDIRQGDTETSDKGKLLDVVLVDTNNQPFTIGLEITPVWKAVNNGDDVQYTATLTNADGSTEDVTTQCIWTIDNDNYTITNGLVSDCPVGSAQITATLDYDSATADLVVLSYTIEISPSQSVVEIRDGDPQTITYKVEKVSSDGYRSDITNDPETYWTHDAGSSWTFVDQELTVTGAGEDVILVTYKGKTAVATVTATETIEDLNIVPYEHAVNVGDSPKYSAIYTVNGEEYDVSSECYWTINDPDFEIDAGTVSAIPSASSNPLSVSATYKGLTASASLSVPMAQEPKTIIEPSVASIDWGSNQQFKAYRVLSDGSRIDITDQVIWACDKYRIGGHQYDVGAIDSGLVTTDTDFRNEGSATITAYLEGDASMATAILNVDGAAPPITPTYQLIIEPSEVWAKLGDEPQLRAYYQDGAGVSTEVTNTASWSIDHFNISQGLVTNIDDDNNIVAVVEAQYDGKTATALLKVPAQITTPLEIVPNPLNLQVGDSRYIGVIDTSGNQRRDVTQWATLSIDKYSISDFGLIDNTNVPGIATITAEYNNGSANGIVNVSYQLDNDYIEIIPKEFDVRLGSTTYPKIWHVYNGVRTQLTIGFDDVTLSTTTPSVIDVVSDRFSCLQIGTGQITATYESINGTRIATATIIVTAYEPELYFIYNVGAIEVGDTKTFTAYYRDETGNSVDVTNSCDWTSTKPSVSSTGVFTASQSSIGTVSVDATYNGVSANGAFTVRAKADPEAVDRRITLRFWDEQGAGGARLRVYLNGEFKYTLRTSIQTDITFTLKQGSNYIRIECELAPINADTIHAFARVDSYTTATMAFINTSYVNFPGLIPNHWYNEPRPGFNWEWYSE